MPYKDPVKLKAYKAQWAKDHIQDREAYRKSPEGKAIIETGRKRWRAKNAARDYITNRRSYLKTTYGISLEDYDQLWNSQNGVCAICRQPEQQDKVLAVDHCHKTNKVRGLLCYLCNIGLGSFQDSALRLVEAAKYIEKHSNNV